MHRRTFFWKLLEWCHEGEGGGSSGAGAAAGSGSGGSSTDPWYKGKADDRMVGHWQNTFPQHLNDPVALAIAATTSHLEAQKMLGAPANELVRIPNKADDPAWAGIYKRFGKPDSAADYELKTSDGKDFEAPFAEVIRQTAFALNLSKDAAQKLATEISKFDTGRSTEATNAHNDKITAARAELQSSWGANFAANKELAKQGAIALKLDASLVNDLENAVGYPKLMEMLRSVGARTAEGQFIVNKKEGGAGDGGPMSVEQAKAKKQELYADHNFVKRFNDGESQAVREMNQLDIIIANARAAA